MVSINKVFVAGNLVRNPELKTLPSGKKTTTMTIAVNEFWRNKDGELTKKTSFIILSAWGNLAENCVKYLSKGKSLMAEGRIETDNYTDKNGQKQFITKINCSSIVFLENNSQNKSLEEGDTQSSNKTTYSKSRLTQYSTGKQTSNTLEVPAIM